MTVFLKIRLLKDRRMLKKSKLYNIILVLLLMFGQVLSGCTRTEDGTESSKKADVVLKFAGEDISLGEVYVYANTIVEQYEKSYGDSVWGMEVPISETETENMETITRKDIIESIVRVKVLSSKAEEYNIKLSADEEDKITRQADAFYKNLTDKQIEEMQLTRDIVVKVYKENEIAGRVYNKVVGNAGIEVSDEDARQTTFYDLVFEKYSVGNDGKVKELSEDEQTVQYERALQAYNTLVNPVSGSGNTNIEGLAEFYGASDSRYYTVSPSKIREMYGNEICEMLYSLEDGSYSLVTESEYGYHIFYMKALTDRDATDKLKESEISTKERNYFATYYEKWLKETDSGYSYDKSVDKDVYDKIQF